MNQHKKIQNKSNNPERLNQKLRLLDRQELNNKNSGGNNYES